MKKNIFVFTLFGFVIWCSFKCFVWQPYFKCMKFPTAKSVLKSVYTILVYPPFEYDGENEHFLEINGHCYFVDSANNIQLKRLVNNYPYPWAVTDANRPLNERVEILAKFVSKLLPKNVPVQHQNEPDRALVLLGHTKGTDGILAPVPKLCSADAKIFVQYVASLGLITRILQLEKHIAASVYNFENHTWEMYDPYFGCALKFEGKNISADEAYELLRKGKKLEYCGPMEVFNTVVVEPRTNFSRGMLPSLHYFSYDNLAYWRVKKVSENSPELWKSRMQ